MSDFTGLMKFSATWCAPCKVAAPAVKEAAEEAGVEVKSIDIDEDNETTSMYGVRSVPTVIAFKDGKPVDMIVGAVDKAKYLELANKAK